MTEPTTTGTPDGFRQNIRTASEALRFALHDRLQFEVDDMEPAEWSSVVCEMHTLINRAANITSALKIVYRKIEDAYPGQEIYLDNGNVNVRGSIGSVVFMLQQITNALDEAGVKSDVAQQHTSKMGLREIPSVVVGAERRDEPAV